MKQAWKMITSESGKKGDTSKMAPSSTYHSPRVNSKNSFKNVKIHHCHIIFHMLNHLTYEDGLTWGTAQVKSTSFGTIQLEFALWQQTAKISHVQCQAWFDILRMVRSILQVSGMGSVCVSGLALHFILDTCIFRPVRNVPKRKASILS